MAGAPPFIEDVHAALIMVLLLASPALAIAAAVGLLIGLGQAALQIMDQGLAQSVKIMAVLLVVLVLGSLLAAPFIVRSQHVFDQIPFLAH